MPKIKSQSGFTLTEILVAIAIMALGFMAVAEMEYLSIRQRQRAEMGALATNVIQFVSDRDMAEVRRRYLLNANTYIDAQADRKPLDLSYCNGSDTSICNPCPCDPLEVLTPNPNPGIESTCAAVDIHNFDPGELDFKTAVADCEADANADMFMVKQATTTQAQNPDTGLQILTVSIIYAVKTPAQLEETDFSVDISDSLGSQSYEVTAHVDTAWSTFIPGWNQVRIPHIP